MNRTSLDRKNADSIGVTKYVYVLASDEKDIYLEQAFISITSLKLHTPNAFVVILTDSKTDQTLAESRKYIRNVVNEFVVVNFDDALDKRTRSRLLKTSVRQHIKGDFLFIDCDTVIASDLSNIANTEADIAAVLGGNACHISEWLTRPFIHGWIKKLTKADCKLGFSSFLKSDIHYNSGVIWCRDSLTSHVFYAKWHELMLQSICKGLVIDEPAFNESDYLLDHSVLHQLDGVWNVTVFETGAVRFLPNAKIIHCCGPSFLQKQDIFLLSTDALFQRIRAAKRIPDDIMLLLNQPQRAFNADTQLIVPDDFLSSVSYQFFNKLHRNGVLQPLEKLLKYCGK